MPDKDPFGGNGWSREPFEPDEIAGLRQMKSEVAERWETVKGADELFKGGKRLATIFATVAAIAAGVAWMIKNGWMG